MRIVRVLIRASSVAFLLKRTGQGDEITAAALAAELARCGLNPSVLR